MQTIKSFLTLSTLSLLLFSCAQQTSPTGGPTDTIPPKLIYSLPKHQQTNFRKQQVDIEFNEQVILNNPKEQILITPDIDKKYEVKLKKNRVSIQFEEPLRDSTTYSINFREAVQDITEKNSAENLKLAFSTGEYIDSLYIRGQIRNTLKDAPSKDATVAIYQSDTFNIFKHKPTYLTKVNPRGRFSIENLKPGTYYIYSFEDKNRNLIVDSKSESYAFDPTPIQLTSKQIVEPLSLIRLDTRELKLTSKRPYNSYYNIKTSKGLKDYKLTTSTNDSIRSAFGEDRSNIRVYNTFANADSIQIKFSAFDSLDNKIDTTFFIKFTAKKIEKEAFTVKLSNVKLLTATRQLTATLTTNKPVLDLNYDSIFIQIDSTTRLFLSSENLTWDQKQNTAELSKLIDQKYFVKSTSEEEQPSPTKQPTWSLHLNPAALLSVELDSSSRAEEKIRPLDPDALGTILIEIKTTKSSFIVELLDKSFNPIAKKTNQSRFSFQNIPPGEYLIRVIDDHNNNQSWDPGNFNKRQPTEQIIYYRNEKKNPTVTLKANWELGPLLIAF